ncbi:asparagine synthetase B family protein [Verrucosispora sp. TAA-831]|uniref:asparagine synthetase B family protein n=1 Tax=Verrucosispora sp. TAA-831 TaxID=3422227 RepID=UPI003D6F75F7
MCGLIGGYRAALDQQAALAAIAHRGPDGSGWQVIGATTLGHTRLAIQDPRDVAAQPFPSGAVTLTYNGEAYNAPALREKLESEGVGGWRTTGDTELVAALLDRHGHAGLDRIEGMFAAAWHDTRTGTWLARDRHGKMPLYAVRAGQRWLWASELKALPVGVPAVAVAPGTAVHVDTGKVHRWARTRPPLPPEPQALRRALRDGVAARLLSDRPVCFLLSGGLDSTFVLALAREIHPNPVAYTAVYDPGSADLAAARRVAAHLDVPLVEIPVPHPTTAAITAAVRTIEIPMKAQVEITLANLPLARAIACDGFRVVLSGEAADELFGGYGNLIRAAHGADDATWRSLRHAQVDKMGRGNFMRVNKVFMAAGVEARLPFMHREVVDLALAAGLRDCPPGKGLLKRAAAGLVPDWVIKRPKDTFQGGTRIADAAARVVSNPVRFYNAEARRLFGYLPKG